MNILGIDGDVCRDLIPLCCGFDSTARTLAQLVANIQADSASGAKYYHCKISISTFYLFLTSANIVVRCVGRSPGRVALEVALQTNTVTLLGEEIESRRLTLRDVVNLTADLVQERFAAGCNFGVVLIPEGVVSMISELRVLITVSLFFLSFVFFFVSLIFKKKKIYSN